MRPKALMGTPTQTKSTKIDSFDRIGKRPLLVRERQFYAYSAQGEHNCRIVMNLTTIFKFVYSFTSFCLTSQTSSYYSILESILDISSGARSEIFCCPLKPFPKILTTLLFSCSSNSLNSMGESPATPACL